MKKGYENINPDDLWTKNGKLLYEAGAYESMIEAGIATLKTKPKETGRYERLKELMIEYLFYTYSERLDNPLDACANMTRYTSQITQILSDAAKRKFWPRYISTVKWVAEFVTKNPA